MAATRIMPVHQNQAWGAEQTIRHSTDYVMNPAKTNGGDLVTAYECDPDIIVEDFMFSRDEYLRKTGREQGSSEILIYHVRQSFVPGEADVETVRRIGYELAMELTGGNHAFIVCTHTDKPHLHNHIIINAVNLDCDGKFRNEIGSYRRVENVSNRLTVENNLSYIENPERSKGTKNRYRKPTKRDGLTAIIDEVLVAGQPKNFDDFLKQLRKKGCKIRRRGNTISVCPPDAERFFRFRAGTKGLPDGYDEESLRRKIADMQTEFKAEFDNGFDKKAEEINDTVHADAAAEHTVSDEPEVKSTPVSDTPTTENMADTSYKTGHEKKINLLIDLENSIKAKDSPGYKRWARGFNLQQAAETLLFLQTQNLTDIEVLTEAANQAKTDYDALQKRIETADTRIKDVNTLQRHIGAYNKNRDVYSQYLRTKRNSKFRQENEKAIATVEEAKAYFNSLGLDKLPSIKELQAEYSALYQEKQNCYQARNEMRQYVFDLQSAKKNVDMLLNVDQVSTTQQAKKKGIGSDR